MAVDRTARDHQGHNVGKVEALDPRDPWCRRGKPIVGRRGADGCGCLCICWRKKDGGKQSMNYKIHMLSKYAERADLEHMGNNGYAMLCLQLRAA